jgi:ABC-type polysaccharide/polyol phosphate transport system ATPase subunit
VTPAEEVARPIAIEAREVQKGFWIPHDRQTTLKERALRPRSWLHAEARQLEALRGVSFDVERGEFFGVIGRNGSGKSTLLKLLASIYKLDGGSIRVAGRLAPFIELGVGFNPELAALDNVVINGVMMGLSPSEARARFDKVIAYAELEDYTDLKLRNYSFGMQVRLAFASMLEVDADVLLVDEVLAVGDLAFQQKCIASLMEKRRAGTAVVLVTHDMEAVQRYCDRAMLIEDGLVETIGQPAQVVERYIEVILPGAAAGAGALGGHGDAGVVAAWLSDAQGRTVQSIPADERVTLCATIRARRSVSDLRMTVELLSHPESFRLASFTIGDDGEIPPLNEGEEATVRVEMDAGSLLPGQYRLGYALRAGGSTGELDRCADPMRLRVTGDGSGTGVALAHRVSVDRGAAGVPR